MSRTQEKVLGIAILILLVLLVYFVCPDFMLVVAGVLLTLAIVLVFAGLIFFAIYLITIKDKQ